MSINSNARTSLAHDSLGGRHRPFLNPRLVFYNIEHTFKGKGLIGRQLGQNLAIEVHMGLLRGGDKLGIAPMVLSDSRLQSHNPELAPFAFFASAISVGVLPRLVDPTNGDPEAVFGATAKALGVFQQVLVLENE